MHSLVDSVYEYVLNAVVLPPNRMVIMSVEAAMLFFFTSETAWNQPGSFERTFGIDHCLLNEFLIETELIIH